MKPDIRKFELDWLRVFAILVVFVYHSTRFFNLGDWHVKNIDTYCWVEMWYIFVTRWMMPLFFVISGASLFFVIGRPGGFTQFYRSKFLRLMIPVLVASVTHSALQVYLDRITHGLFSGSFISFLSIYFNGLFLRIGKAGGNFAFHGMHLWYLLFLFMYGLICYPLFLWLKGRGQAVMNGIESFFSIPGLMYIGFIIPFLLMKTFIPDAILELGNGGWGYLYYLWFLIAGLFIISSDHLQNRILNQRWFSLILAIVTSILLLFQLFSSLRIEFSHLIDSWVVSLLNYLNAWCWVLAIFGFGKQLLSMDRPILKHLNEGVLPFFILHQTVLLIVGYFITDWNIHDVLKWVLITVSSFGLILAMYIPLIRKFDLLRFLFGMKTTHSFYKGFYKWRVLIILHLLYFAAIAFAATRSYLF